MKKTKKLLSLIMGFALALVAVITFTVNGNKLTAQAEEAELPDTSTWEEVDASDGDSLTGVWYRAYFGESYYTEILTFYSENYTTKYQGYNSYTEDNVPSEAIIPLITLKACKQEKYIAFFGNSNSGSCNLNDIIPYSITETYIEFYIPSNLEFDMGLQYCAGPQVSISRIVTLNEDAKITTVNGELKKLVEPTPDDGTEEPKDAITDKFSNWLNDTFGFKTTGSVVGSIALLVAGAFLLKAVLGKK